MSTATATTPLPTGTWSVDPANSRLEFEAKHLGIAPVRGSFDDFEGALELGDDLAGVRAYGSVAVASVDTSNEKRDAHLRSPDFFDAEQFPELTFESGEIRALDAETFVIAGRLTIHGITRPITLSAEVKGTETDPSGNQRLALELAGELNRGDYGMTHLMVLVSNKVRLRLEISAVKEDGHPRARRADDRGAAAQRRAPGAGRRRRVALAARPSGHDGTAGGRTLVS